MTTLTLIARQRADTGTPRYQGIMAGLAGEMNFYCFHHFHRYHSHLITLSLSRLHTPPCEMSSHDPELASEDVTLPIQYGARRGSELLMNDQ